MDEAALISLLEGVRAGATPVRDAARELKRLPYAELGYAKVDHHRELRAGYPEVIFCQGKATEHIVGIVKELLREGPNLLATRASREVFEAVAAVAPDAEYNALARTVCVRRRRDPHNTANAPSPNERAICVSAPARPTCPSPKRRA